MVVEWFFLMSVLSGPFDPNCELGWKNVERTRHAFKLLDHCESARGHA